MRNSENLYLHDNRDQTVTRASVSEINGYRRLCDDPADIEKGNILIGCLLAHIPERIRSLRPAFLSEEKIDHLTFLQKELENHFQKILAMVSDGKHKKKFAAERALLFLKIILFFKNKFVGMLKVSKKTKLTKEETAALCNTAKIIYLNQLGAVLPDVLHQRHYRESVQIIRTWRSQLSRSEHLYLDRALRELNMHINKVISEKGETLIISLNSQDAENELIVSLIMEAQKRCAC